MEENYKKSLLIIGNGFDINCGLKSKFSDFFESKIDEISECASTYNNYRCSNIWYLLFYFAFYDDSYRISASTLFVDRIHKKDILWMDVESFIKKIIYTKKDKDKWMDKHLPSTINDYPSYLSYIYKNRHEKYIIGENNQKNSLRKHFLQYGSDSFDVYRYLYDELIKFEDEFKQYLISITKSNINYLTNSETIFRSIIDFDKEPFSIISFNYTHSFDFAMGFNKERISSDFYNIHGDLDNSIIIGYDSSDVMNNETNGILLSKSWQKMNTMKCSFVLPDKKSISHIKFYGHSLSEQDYSYFHALFDYYNIYNSSIVLVFYYTEYGMNSDDNRSIRSRYVSAIYRLLTDYATKSGNEEKVTTIISRLHLENRLRIELVPVLGNKK